MAAYKPQTAKFDISVDGEFSGEKWHGEFEAKFRLSHQDRLIVDAERRRLMGENPAGATDETINTANAFAELSVRIVKAPSWWSETRGGLDLVDYKPVQEVYNKTMKLESDDFEAMRKKSAAAKERLEAEQAEKPAEG